MTMIKRRQAQTTDSIARNPAALELSKIGYQSNRFSQSDVDFWKANLAGVSSAFLKLDRWIIMINATPLLVSIQS